MVNIITLLLIQVKVDHISLENKITIFIYKISGDDMFATFSMLPQKLGVVHGFSRVFLYR